MAIQCVIKERACAGSRTSTPAPSHHRGAPAMTDDLRQAMAALGAGAPHASSTNPGATSDLSIDEALLLHSIGWEPVDLVFAWGGGRSRGALSRPGRPVR